MDYGDYDPKKVDKTYWDVCGSVFVGKIPFSEIPEEKQIDMKWEFYYHCLTKRNTLSDRKLASLRRVEPGEKYARTCNRAG